MRRNQRALVWLGISILAVLTLSALLVQASPDSEEDGPVITDWSSHHVIFSRPATAEQAQSVERDPRYWQQVRRQLPVVLPEAETESDSASTSQPSSDVSFQRKNQALGRDWAEDMGGGATVGAANYPAKFSFKSTTASCAADFVVFNTGNLGSAPGKPSLLAYNNLYSGCTAPVPAVYWAFNTGGQIMTSTALSRDGTQIAFVQTTGAGVSYLALLKWKASRGTVASPAVPGFATAPFFPGCPAPCMTTLKLVDSGVAARDTNSSPFYDYGNDALYVGDDSGYLHKFTPVFSGVPLEVTTGGWPLKVNSSAPTALTNPVLDSVTGNVFVEDKGGYLYRVNSTGAATPTQSGLLDHSTALDTGPGMVQGPIVDSSARLVYVFATSDGSSGCTGGVDCTVIYEVSTSFAANIIPVSPEKVSIGSSTAHGTAPNRLYIGAFDSTYESSVDPPTGNLYVCGDTGGNAILYRVPITAGSFGTVTPIVATTTAANHRACAPVSDVSNPNTSVGTMERVFFGVVNSGLPTLCAGGGCALSFVDTPWQKDTLYNVGQEVLVIRGDNTPWINVAISNGTTAGSPPTWPAGVGAETIDGTVIWLNQGATTLTPLASWVANQVNGLQARIVDNNGNVEIVALPGTSGAGPAPNWNTTAGGLTLDGTVTWINAGVLPSAALASSAGTSGFIIDNVVGSGVQVGASQVYFSTLANQACTGGTGGCAVQASQSGLQ